jgi:hypothetical protein
LYVINVIYLVPNKAVKKKRKISGGVQAAPLSELRQGLGVWVEAFHTK